MFNQEIFTLLMRLMATQSDTNTFRETYISEQILIWLKEQAYFRANPEYCGLAPLKDDPYDRSVVWAFVKGKTNKTVVLINHHDAIDIEEYGKLKPYALHPEELKEAMLRRKWSKSVERDLNSDDWIFGRGSADMKSGAAIQLVLTASLAERKDLDGNIVFLSVPDEESLSKGMLSAIPLLSTLRETYNLDFKLAINSEPYFNQQTDKAIFYEGSVGKIMPVLYVKGVKSHIGDPFAGFNPSLVLADLQKKTELNVDLCDQFEGEATPPPVWVNLKDRKKAYDASIPEAATGYFNWLTFTRSPQNIMKKLVSISKRTLRDTLIHFQDAYENYCMLTNETPIEIDFNPKVLTYEELLKEAKEVNSTKFQEAFDAYQNDLFDLLMKNKITLPESSTRLIEFLSDWVDLEGPAIVIALSGPYYPHVHNTYTANHLNYSLEAYINSISMEHHKVEFVKKNFFMGISDLSYVTWAGNDPDIDCIKSNSPGWDTLYKIPFKDLKTLDMPIVNIGPWGKDLHKITERVFKKDVLETIPNVIYNLILKTFE